MMKTALRWLTPRSMSFNWDASLLATTCKDRMIRIIDPRTGAVVQQGQVRCPGLALGG
jgi:hypothetical protein